MKKLLILAYDFPPYVSVGGLRPYNWFKHLKEYGIEPIVITRQWSNNFGNQLDYVAAGSSDDLITEFHENGTILRSPYHPNLSNRLLLKYGENRFRWPRRIISGYYEYAQFYYPTGPKAEIYKAARNYLMKNKVDAIIASGDPFVLFSYAAKLSKEFDIPWIADYRDPWTHNSELEQSGFLKRWSSKLESSIVESASAITTVSTFVQHKIEKLISGKEFVILPNGYDPEAIDKVRSLPQATDALNIAFVGTIYNWHPIESFLRVSEKFVNDHPEAKLTIHFYGTNLQDELKQWTGTDFPALKNCVHISPRIPNADLLELLAQNHVMLLFNYYSYMGTKIFDYIGIRRKIILCYSDDPDANILKEKFYRVEEVESESGQLQANLIRETNSGIIVKDSSHLRQVLEDLWNEFNMTGKIACESVHVEKYSRTIQTKKLAEFILKLDN